MDARREDRQSGDHEIHGTPFADGHTQLRAELRWLDMRIEREIRRFRSERSVPVDEFRGLYVSEDQVEALLHSNEAERPGFGDSSSEAERELKARNSARGGAHLPLQRVCAVFGLDEFECEVLVLATAPELDLRYELLYSYLNNDVTRKRPNCDLALRLFCPETADRWMGRGHFAPDAPLFRYGLLEWLPENADAPASSLAQAFKASTRVVDFLLELPAGEAKLASLVEGLVPTGSWDDLLLPVEFLNSLRGARRLLQEEPPPALILEGSGGAGRQACAEALCVELGCALLVVDVEATLASPMELAEIFKLLGREQGLRNAGLYFRGAESFFDAEGRVQARARGLAASLALCTQPIFFACAQPCDFKALLPNVRFHLFRFPALPFPLRRKVWERELETVFRGRNGADLEALASQFVLTGGQIGEAVRSARDKLRLRGDAPASPCTADLFAAARSQSQTELRSLAQGN